MAAPASISGDQGSTTRKIRDSTRPRGLRSKPLRRYPPEVLSPDEIRALIECCPSNTPAGIRNRALLTILYRAGLRITEALALRPLDLDPRKGAIRILHAKGDRSRTVGMDAAGFAILDHIAPWDVVEAMRGRGW